MSWNLPVPVEVVWWAALGLLAGAAAYRLSGTRQPLALAVALVLGPLGALVGGLVAWAVLAGLPGPWSGPAARLALAGLGATAVLRLFLAHLPRSLPG